MKTRITANKIVLSSQSTVFSSFFSSISPSDLLPKHVSSFDRQQSLVSLSFPAPRIFHLFLQYLYGGQLTLKSRNQPVVNEVSKSDSPPSTSTSKTSLDESVDDSGIWNNLYDKFSDEKINSFDIFRDSSFNEEHVVFDKAIFPQSKRKSPVYSSDDGSKSAIAESIVSYESESLREDLNLLRTLGVSFRVDDLIKRLVS